MERIMMLLGTSLNGCKTVLLPCVGMHAHMGSPRVAVRVRVRVQATIHFWIRGGWVGLRALHWPVPCHPASPWIPLGRRACRRRHPGCNRSIGDRREERQHAIKPHTIPRVAVNHVVGDGTFARLKQPDTAAVLNLPTAVGEDVVTNDMPLVAIRVRRRGIPTACTTIINTKVYK